MARIALSHVPHSGRDLEDYVAGMFQAAGYFVEKNIHQRDVSEVLELDAVATSYDGPVPRSVLAEAKGGRWGFPDIFKVAGWMAYLGIDRSGFFVKEGAGVRDVERIHRAVAPMGVSLVDLGDFSDPSARLDEGGFRSPVSPLLLEVWRLSFWVERTLLDKVRAERRAQPDLRGPEDVLLYHDLVNDHVFFLKDVAERLRRIYAAYRSHPRLSATLAAELAEGPFRLDAPTARGGAPPGAPWTRPGDRVLAEAMFEGKHPALQGSFYVEHRARLSILKACIDLACLAAAGQLPRPDDARETFAALPATFREGFRTLRTRPSFRRYAVLWQVFLWGLGGFYLADREAEEFGWLAAQSGIPVGEIGVGLRAFDDLFPLGKGSWIVPVKGTTLRIAKMVPMAFRGVGAVQRLRRARARNFDGFGLGSLTRRNLITWHNALIRLLATDAPPAAPAKR